MDFYKKTQERGRRVAIYIRVSTEEQKVDGYGLEAQMKKLEEYVNGNSALKLTIDPKHIYSDTHTGSDIMRPELNRLRENARKKQFDAVLVWKIDRFSRSLKHLLLLFEELKTNDIGFISMQEGIDFKGAIGTLIFQIFGAIAEFERSLIKGRTMMGKIASAEAGNYTGTSIPFGYKEVKNKQGKGKKIAIHSSESKWVKKIYDWYIYDEMGYGQIAKKLNKLGVEKSNHTRTKRASLNWTVRHVKTIIEQSLYRGQFVANKKDEDGNLLPEDKWTISDVPRIVSDFIWFQAQQVREGRVGDNSRDYLLSGKIYDVTLDKPRKFVGKKRSKGGFSYCRKQDTSKGLSVFEVPAKPIEDYVWQKIVEALKDPEVFIKHYLSQEYTDPKKITKLQEDLSALRSKQANLELEIERVEMAYETGRYSEDKMSSKVMEKTTQLTNTQEKISEIENEIEFVSSIDLEVSRLREASKQVRYRLDKLDRIQQKRLCSLFIDRINLSRTEVPSSGKRKQWNITADIVFRFNPEKLQQHLVEGRTSKGLNKEQRLLNKVNNFNHGGRCKT